MPGQATTGHDTGSQIGGFLRPWHQAASRDVIGMVTSKLWVAGSSPAGRASISISSADGCDFQAPHAGRCRAEVNPKATRLGNCWAALRHCGMAGAERAAAAAFSFLHGGSIWPQRAGHCRPQHRHRCGACSCGGVGAVGCSALMPPPRFAWAPSLPVRPAASAGRAGTPAPGRNPVPATTAIAPPSPRPRR